MRATRTRSAVMIAIVAGSLAVAPYSNPEITLLRASGRSSEAGVWKPEFGSRSAD
ncbi:MAG TPA: hypothetical protein VEZ90_07730 [Blastocatellia bacterium]|nr:hypothetical protein [Blastocatellia bacterium]